MSMQMHGQAACLQLLLSCISLLHGSQLQLVMLCRGEQCASMSSLLLSSCHASHGVAALSPALFPWISAAHNWCLMCHARMKDNWAAVRVLARDGAAEAVQHEAQVYEVLSPLQGEGVPQCLGAGPLPAAGQFYVATKFVEVKFIRRMHTIWALCVLSGKEVQQCKLKDLAG